MRSDLKNIINTLLRFGVFPLLTIFSFFYGVQKILEGLLDSFPIDFNVIVSGSILVLLAILLVALQLWD